MTKRTYEFKQWDTLPKVSCTCITYGRPDLLEEAIESFLQQDYPGEAELIVLNDLVGLTLTIDPKYSTELRTIKVINDQERASTIGAKRNKCTKLSSGEIVLPWDDDDIHLPWRISLTIDRMTNKRHWKPEELWFWNNGEIVKKIPTKSMAPSMAGYSRALFDEVGGYEEINSGQDQTLANRFQKVSARMVEAISPREVYYIYRFGGTGSYHLSTHGYGKGKDQATKYVEGKKLKGIKELIPTFRSDYVSYINSLCNDMEKKG